MRKTKIICVGNAKGGVGKSSVTMLLAVALAYEKKKKVLILDNDNQQSIYDYYQSVDNSLVDVEAIEVQRVSNYLNRVRGEYDFIFLDIPRITRKKETGVLAVLANCDSVLIPVVGGSLDLLSTVDFVEICESIKETRKKDKLPFAFFGFLNRKNRRSINGEVLEYLNNNGLPMFESSLSDLKVFSVPTLSRSATTTAPERFTPFYNEFISKLKL